MNGWKLTEEREQARLAIQDQVIRERQAKAQGKRIVMVQGVEKLVIDPDFCPHTNAFTVSEHGETWLECPDCNARISEDGEFQLVGNSIPIFEEEL